MPLPSTQFNPFGRHEKTVASLKTEMNEALRKIEEDDGAKSLEWATVAKKYTKIIDQLIEIVKDIPDYAIQSLLVEIVTPFSKFLSILGAKSSEELRTYDYSNLIRKLSQFIRNIADNAVEPFNSDVLEQWAPLFEAFFTAKHNSLKENGASLWKKTFGRIKTPLRWPGNLRKTLEKLPKKLAIILPPIARASMNSSLLFLDDEAMDGLSASSVSSADSGVNFKQPESKSQNGEAPESQSSFQFSQQPEANAMADKILKDNKMKAETMKSPKVVTKLGTSSSRRRTGKISLLDEDSCDFIPITSTPPSNRKVRLTDHQKETLSINRTDFIDEESQNPENLKQALRVNNYALDEDSISAPIPAKSVNPEAPNDIDIDETSSHSISKSSARHLFDDILCKSLPLASSTNLSFVSADDTNLKKTPSLEDTLPKSPPFKRSKIDDSTVITTKNCESDAELEKLPQIVPDDISFRKRFLRVKNTPKQCISVERKSLRGSFVDTNPITQESSVVLERPVKEEAVKSVDPIEPDDSFADAVPMEDLETAITAKSPPKTPRTPSILRASKRMGSDSPMTERKRNRVHFNEDSLPQELTSSPVTPRRKPGSHGKSPLRPPLATASSFVDRKSSTNSLLEMESSTGPTSTPFFPALVDCKDRIDKIIPNLVFMCRKTYMDSAKKSLQSIGVKTVGNFAALSKVEVEKLTWIKGKAAGAKIVLTQHEKSWSSVAVTEDVEDLVKSVEPMESAVPAEVENDPTTPEKLSEKPRVFEPQTIRTAGILQKTTDKCATPQKEVDFVPVVSESITTPTLSGLMTSEVHKTPQKMSDVSQLPGSPIISIVPTLGSSVSREGSAEVSPKYLAPIFLVKAKEIKKENQSPQKTEMQKQIENAETSFQEDGRLLHRICVNLSNAHTQNKWPLENSTKLLSNLNKAAIFFKNIVQTRGDGEWDDVEFENEYVNSGTSSVEENIESLVKVYKRFSRQHTSSMASCLPWRSVMDCINESACLLESIFLARTLSS